MASIQASELQGKSNISRHITKLNDIPKFQRDKAGADIFFEETYNHEGQHTCDKCRGDKQEIRQPRASKEEVVTHYGTIASGNQVVKNAVQRDEIRADFGSILCFDREVAGLTNSFPCLVIRGIWNYADSHANTRWHAYAAGTASACAKEVLSVIPPTNVATLRTLEEVIGETNGQCFCYVALIQPSCLSQDRTLLPCTPSSTVPFQRNDDFISSNSLINIHQI